MQIAIDAGKSKIIEIVCPTMYLRNDMFDMKCGQRGIVLMRATVLTRISRPLANSGSSPRPDHLKMMVL